MCIRDRSRSAHARRVVREQAARIDRRVHVREHVGDAAELRDRPVELPPCPRVGSGGLERCAGDADRLRGNADPAPLEICLLYTSRCV